MTPEHLQFAATEFQRRVVELSIGGASTAQIAEEMGAAPGSVRSVFSKVRRRAELHGYIPEQGDAVPQTLPVSGVSTLLRTNESGSEDRLLRWVKTRRTDAEIVEVIREIAKGLTDEIPKVRPVSRMPGYLPPSMMIAYTLVDVHLGMMAWAAETGEDYDLEIAQRDVLSYFASTMARCPPAEHGVLLGLGDFLHYDSMTAVTPKNRHHLDSAARFPKILRVALRLVKALIRMMLTRHEKVSVIMLSGNHDEVSGAVLRESMDLVYEDEMRVFVDTSPMLYGCLQHGKTGIFHSHGHGKPPPDIDKVFVAEFAEVYASTKYRYAHIAHRHHLKMWRSPLMSIEQHDPFTARDAYAASNGHQSERRATAIHYHDRFGEVGRTPWVPEMKDEPFWEEWSRGDIDFGDTTEEAA